MCFICEIVTGKQQMTEEQSKELLPVANALSACKGIAAGLQGNPSSVHLCRLAQLRGADHVPLLFNLSLAFENLRGAAEALTAANNKARAEAVHLAAQESFQIPPDLGESFSPEQVEQLNKLNEQVKNLALELVKIDGSTLRKLYNVSTSPGAQNIIRILGEAREEILSDIL